MWHRVWSAETACLLATREMTGASARNKAWQRCMWIQLGQTPLEAHASRREQRSAKSAEPELAVLEFLELSQEVLMLRSLINGQVLSKVKHVDVSRLVHVRLLSEGHFGTQSWQGNFCAALCDICTDGATAVSLSNEARCRLHD